MGVTYASLSASQQNAVQAIINVAQQKGVNARTALASAWQESKFNPNAVNSSKTSFGLFQLTKGGELGNASPEQAFDPTFNANTALSVFASMQSKYSDPGTLAAKAQRPYDPRGYAKAVDSYYSDPSFLPDLPAAGGTVLSGNLGGTQSSGFSVSDAFSTLTSISTWIRVLEVIAGGALILLGLGLTVKTGVLNG